jgi:subtilase family serine protease
LSRWRGWGGGESSSDLSYDSHFSTPSGVTFIASAGDSAEGVEYPAVSPYVVGVGGTSLYLTSSGNYSSETAWSSSGGGLSGVYSQPGWQSGWQNWSSTRGVPDINFLADPNTGVYVAYNNSWYVFGGTSVGAPNWAGLVALANQLRAGAGKATLSHANSVFYSLAGTAPNINSGNFIDIASGNNGSDPDDAAVAGYDLVTGLGSPAAAKLIPALGTY